ncbi:DUF7146 domain-containing protein [Sphingomonas sp. TX0543]|uniref:DUF7146 domain-containing protein n=1 Tax=Sphingomonas sp. TX0543 TaxID=3399682 RepID=UPI003AFB2465
MALVALRPTQDLIDLVGSLGGTWHGRTAMCPCPAHADSTPSLSIRQGNQGILVTCFAGCDREDVLRELRRVPSRGRFAYTDTPTARSGNAERLWDEALPLDGTLAERYLRLRHLWPVTHDLRFHPRCPYRPKPWTTYHPALIVAVREGRRLTAVQRIFLDPLTARYRMKLMLGQPGQGAWQGGGQAVPVLALAEGFETARAFTILHDIPCWTSLGARRLDQLLLPSSLTSLILAVDNDAEGAIAAERAALRYARPDLVITPMPPKGVKDWAKVLEMSRR